MHARSMHVHKYYTQKGPGQGQVTKCHQKQKSQACYETSETYFLGHSLRRYRYWWQFGPMAPADEGFDGVHVKVRSIPKFTWSVSYFLHKGICFWFIFAQDSEYFICVCLQYLDVAKFASQSQVNLWVYYLTQKPLKPKYPTPVIAWLVR